MSDEEEKEAPKRDLFRSIRNHFFTGVIIAIPIMATIWLITFVDGRLLSLIPPELNPNNRINDILGFSIPGVGIVLGVISLWLLGLLASNFIGNALLGLGERLLSRVPLVSNIYNALKQIVTTMAAQGDRAFQDVCLIEYPRKGLWAMGFVTSDLRGAPAKVLPEGYVCVFVPTTPNPTSGFLLFVKSKDVKILDMTPEEGAKMIISGGMVASDEDLEKPRNGKTKKKKLPQPSM